MLSQGKSPSSVNITAVAGLAQPTFYAHFKSVDACVLASAQYVQEKLQERHDYERTNTPTDKAPSRGATEDFVARWLEASMTTGPMIDALSRFRHDKTAVGDLVRQMKLDVRTSMAEQLFTSAARAGVSREHFHEFYLLAELFVASALAMSRLVIEGKVESVEAGAATLTSHIGALVYVTSMRCGADKATFLRNAGWKADKSA